jgi:two-component system, NtrC family, sensor kinase
VVVMPLMRKRVQPFSARQVELVSTFADQAAIAIENSRLFNETREALERQTATADVLNVISRSPTDAAPVFDIIGERAERLCNAEISVVSILDGDLIKVGAIRGITRDGVELVRANFPMSLDRQTVTARTINSGTVVHIGDVLADTTYDNKGLAEQTGYRSCLGVPLHNKGQVVGAIFVARTEAGLFSENQIRLLEIFADQAVIAIENVKLFEEVQAKTRDLEESLQQQTATADVLKVISRSTVDLETVLDTLVETAARLCRADWATLFHQRGDIYHLVAAHGLTAEVKEFILAYPPTADRGTISGRVALERRAVHIPDILQDPQFTYREATKLSGARTMLGIPLLREDTLVGIFVVARGHVEPFTSKEIELVTTFADQAVIAIENARLFEELRDRQAELRVTFDNMGDGVAMFGDDTRLVAWNRNFQTILDLPNELVAQRPTYVDYVRILAERGEFGTDDIEGELNRRLQDTDRELRLERTRPDGRVIEVRRNTVPGGGFVLIYADITERKRAEQAIRAARDAAEKALRELQTAQASLVHAQKMAALGQVTAGIAHEIKNPLNFVNNFAGLSVELLDELKEAARAVGALDPGKSTEIVETIRMLTGNLEKIVEHGRRADGIVRSMLQHSRGSSDDRQPTDLNALAEEALNLAYHGARAQDPNFDIALEHDLDSNLAPVDVVPQELTRVLLNLIGNGFYAANKRSRESNGAYRPALRVTTREFGESVEVRVRDNGIGVPPENRDKLFQPFFTTKPTGEGTGLGLSISYEIITQQHGGTITVASEVGDFTEFTVRLPRRRHAVARGTA